MTSVSVAIRHLVAVAKCVDFSFFTFLFSSGMCTLQRRVLKPENELCFVSRSGTFSRFQDLGPFWKVFQTPAISLHLHYCLLLLKGKQPDSVKANKCKYHIYIRLAQCRVIVYSSLHNILLSS